jgi:hypothetical protein
MVKPVLENGMEADICGLVLVVVVRVEMRFWLDDLWLRAAASTSEGDNKSLNLHGENQGLAFIGCVSQWFCWSHCFASVDVLLGEKLRSMIRVMTAFAHCLLLVGVVFLIFLVLAWWCLACCYNEYITWLLFYVILYFYHMHLRITTRSMCCSLIVLFVLPNRPKLPNQ